MKISATLFILVLLGKSLHAQQAFTNSGNLQIFSGTSVSGFGDFTNASTAAFVNNGSIYIKGTLTNNQSSMATGTGTLNLNGTIAQSVAGTQPFKTYNLITDNTAGITLNTNLSVSGTHTYTNGLIASSATPNYLIYEAGSSYSGATDARHTTGWVKKIGNTNFSFPVGDATYLRTAGIINLAVSSEFNCHYYKPTANIFNLTAPLVQVNSREYWQINEITGSNSQIVLNWDNSKVAFDLVILSEIRVGVYTGGSWRSAGGSPTGNVLTTGTVTSFIGNAFNGPMTFGYGADILLPLKIISFTAERRAGISYLHWITTDEKDVDHFDIQRSYDGVSFVSIGSAAGRNSSQQESYTYEDATPLQGVAYYRIKAIDANNKSVSTKIVAVSETSISNNLFTVINPARNVVTVFNKSGAEGTFQYKLINAGGQVVSKGNINITINGIGAIPVPSQSAAGIYILELGNSQIEFKQKIVIEK